MWVLRILRFLLFSLPVRGLAFQVPPEPGGSTVIYCYCTFLWTSFVFVVLKLSHHFSLEFDGRVSVTKIACSLSSLPSVRRITDKFSFVLYAFEKPRKVTINFVMSACPSVRRSVQVEQLGSH